MAITPSTLPFFLRVRIDFSADTLAEVEADKASYSGKYIRVADQSNHLYYVEPLPGGDFLVREAYEQSNYESIDSVAAGTEPREVYVQETAPASTGQPFLWVQTGLGDAGDDFTIWFDNGL